MRVPRVCSPWRSSVMVSHCLTVSCGESERQGATEQLDVMGFLFLVQGGSVPIITAHSASILRRTCATHLSQKTRYRGCLPTLKCADMKPPEMNLRVLRAAPRRRVPLNLGVDATTCFHHAAAPNHHNRQDGSNG